MNRSGLLFNSSISLSESLSMVTCKRLSLERWRYEGRCSCSTFGETGNPKRDERIRDIVLSDSPSVRLLPTTRMRILWIVDKVDLSAVCSNNSLTIRE